MSSLGRIVEAWTNLISTFAIGQTLNAFESVQTWLMLHLWRVVISDSRASTHNIPLFLRLITWISSLEHCILLQKYIIILLPI